MVIKSQSKKTLNIQPIITFKSQNKFTDWLAKYHNKSNGIWLKLAKKSSNIPSVSYFEAVDVALCYGWIDGIRKAFDDKYYLQKFTPRRPKSIWSKTNVDKVTRLITSGHMKPPGLLCINAAKIDGRWDKAYDGSKTMTVSPDFQKALNKNKKALAFFNTLTRAQKYSFLFRIHIAKKEETRIKRIKKFIDMLQNNQHFHLTK